MQRLIATELPYLLGKGEPDMSSSKNNVRPYNP